MQLLVTGLGKQKMILGFPWLQKHNPIMNWQIRTFKWQHIPHKVNFRKQIKDPLAKLLPKTRSLHSPTDPIRLRLESDGTIGVYWESIGSPWDWFPSQPPAKW